MAPISGNRPGLLSRLASGIRNTIQTVSAGEAYLAQKTGTKKVQQPAELGVLKHGTRFKSLSQVANPFQTSGVRPATGPTVSRPADERFKGTGGAFAPELTNQLTQGPGGLMGPYNKLGSMLEGIQNNPTIQQGSSQLQQITGLGPDQLSSLSNSDSLNIAQQLASQGALQQAKFMQLQTATNQIDRMFQTISQVLSAAHQASMNSIRNMKG